MAMEHSSPVAGRAVAQLRLPPRTSRLLVPPRSGEQVQVSAALLLVQVSAALLLVQVSAGLLPAAMTGQLVCRHRSVCQLNPDHSIGDSFHIAAPRLHLLLWNS